MMSAKTLPPNGAAFGGSRWMDISGGCYSVQYKLSMWS